MLHLRPLRHRTLVAVAVLAACGGGSKDDDKPAMPATPVIVGDTIAVSTQDRVFKLDTKTVALTLKSTVSTPLTGTQFGVDFQLVAGRLRLVSNTSQNLRVDVTTGAALMGGAANGAPASITASTSTHATTWAMPRWHWAG